MVLQCAKLAMLTARKLGAISITVPRIHTYRSGEGNGRCRGSDACEVFRSLLQFIPQYTITSIIKGTSRVGLGSNRYVTLLFSNGASWSLSETCSSAKNRDGFEFV